jgi:hypothetical protein
MRGSPSAGGYSRRTRRRIASRTWPASCVLVDSVRPVPWFALIDARIGRRDFVTTTCSSRARRLRTLGRGASGRAGPRAIPQRRDVALAGTLAEQGADSSGGTTAGGRARGKPAEPEHARRPWELRGKAAYRDCRTHLQTPFNVAGRLLSVSGGHTFIAPDGDVFFSRVRASTPAQLEGITSTPRSPLT